MTRGSLLIFLALVGCGTAEPLGDSRVPETGGEVEPLPDSIPALVEALAIAEGPASSEPFVTLGNEENHRTAERVYRVAAELRARGRAAFPALVDHLDDPRPSVPFRRVLPSTVGDACYSLLTEQLHALPEGYPGSFYREGADGGSHPRPVFMNPFLEAEELGKWLEDRRSKSLVELQVEVLSWVLEEERRIGAANAADHRRYIAPLETRLGELRSQLTRSTASASSPAA